MYVWYTLDFVSFFFIGPVLNLSRLGLLNGNDLAHARSTACSLTSLFVCLPFDTSWG